MLSKQHRLPIQTVLGKAGRVLRTPYFSIKIFLSPLPHARVGVIVSGKVSKKAVRRNKIRRSIFNAFSRDFLNRNPGKDILIIANPKIMELKATELQSQLAKSQV